MACNCVCTRFGIIFALIASVLMALSTVFADKVVGNVDAVVPSALMYTVLAFISTPLMLKNKEWMEASKKQWALAIVSGILSGIYIFTRIESMKYISPVDTSALTQTQLVFVVILACLWLKEPLGIYEIVFILMIICGTFLVTQPEFIFGSTHANKFPLRYIGIILALVAAICSSIMSCIVRNLHIINPYLISYLQGVSASVTLLVFSITRRNVLPNLEEWKSIILSCVSGAFTVLLYTLAYKREQASVVTAISSSETFFTVFFQIIVIQTIPSGLTIFGALLILIGVTAIPMKEQIVNLINQLHSRFSGYNELS